MQKSLQSFIIKEKLFTEKDRILLAVSGGIDSVVMSVLFHKAGFKFGIAHCNFQLRGKESDSDEKFVKQLADKMKVPFYCRKFETLAYKKDNKTSVQVAARELRYQWFEEIREKGNYKYIATAHHQDDSIETFFINLIRGTGIAGLHGILPKQAKIIRPLLFATKEEIVVFAKKENLKFREDSSNVSDKYMRNKIRHHLIPLLKELNPDISATINSTILRLTEVGEIYKNEMERTRKIVIKYDLEIIPVSIKELKKLHPLSAYLFELLKPYHFNPDTVAEIINALDGESGKLFLSPTHRLIKDRDYLIIEEISKPETNVKKRKIPIDWHTSAFISDNLEILFKMHGSDFKIPKSATTASLDYNKLKFPLEIRKWERGDVFYPFGMKGKKKVSDFFTDNKLSVFQKESTRLLISDGKIAWIIGMRIDERFKVTDKTKKIYFAELVK